MISGQGINQVLGLFDFWTIEGVTIDPLKPILNDKLFFTSRFRLPKTLGVTNVLVLIDGYNPPKYNDHLSFTDSFTGTSSTEWDDELLFDDLFDADYYHPERTINQSLFLNSYFTYLLVPVCD